MTTVSERIVNYLLGAEMLFEDRLDDMVQKFGMKIPGETPEAKRQSLERWASYDPTRNKKYFPWYFKQYLKGAIKLDDHTLDHLRDILSDFEHYLTLPAFDASRDIYQYDYKTLDKTISQYREQGIASKKDLKRGRETLGGTVVSEAGDLRIIGFRDGNSLAQEAWRAYSAENPNWKGKPHYPTDPEYNQGSKPYAVDHLWCIRNPQRGADYIKNIPSKMFYVVQKNDWPYVGVVLGSWGSQIVNLENRQIDAGMTEEIYDVMRPILDEYAKNKWEVGHAASGLFGKLRIIRGELKPGESINGADLQNCIANTKINALPEGLKVKGSLDVSGTGISSLPNGMEIGTLNLSNTPIATLPSGLKVTTLLNISGTPIKALPNDMKVTKVIYSPETLSNEEIRRYFFFLRYDDLKKHFWKNPKVNGFTDEQKEAAWQEFQPGLLKWFNTAPNIGQAVAAMFEPSRESKRK